MISLSNRSWIVKVTCSQRKKQLPSQQTQQLPKPSPQGALVCWSCAGWGQMGPKSSWQHWREGEGWVPHAETPRDLRAQPCSPWNQEPWFGTCNTSRATSGAIQEPNTVRTSQTGASLGKPQVLLWASRSPRSPAMLISAWQAVPRVSAKTEHQSHSMPSLWWCGLSRAEGSPQNSPDQLHLRTLSSCYSARVSIPRSHKRRKEVHLQTKELQKLVLKKVWEILKGNFCTWSLHLQS